MRPIALALVSTAILVAGIKHSFDRPVFVYLHHPDLPIERYAAGQLGIPDPNHARLYLYAASIDTSRGIHLPRWSRRPSSKCSGCERKRPGRTIAAIYVGLTIASACLCHRPSLPIQAKPRSR